LLKTISNQFFNRSDNNLKKNASQTNSRRRNLLPHNRLPP
jgi:hypothetical protein